MGVEEHWTSFGEDLVFDSFLMRGRGEPLYFFLDILLIKSFRAMTQTWP